MKQRLLLLFLLAVWLTGYSQTQINDPHAQLRTVPGFSGVAVGGGIDLLLSAGTEGVVVSAARPEDRDHITTEVVNGVLTIGYDGKWSGGFRGNKRLKAYVGYKLLNLVEASGGSDITIDGLLASDSLTLRLSGGSDVRGTVDVRRLTVRQSGGSDAALRGRVGFLLVDASGASDFGGYSLVADVCELEASGASDIEVTAIKELAARASGASSIHYKGAAAVREARSSGSSSVKQQ